MPHWLYNLLKPKPKINRAKPGPQRRAAEHAKMIEKTRQLRYELGLGWKL